LTTNGAERNIYVAHTSAAIRRLDDGE